MKNSLGALAVLSFLFASPSAATAESPQSVLAEVKMALGGAAWDAVKAARWTARVETGGLSGTVESFEDLATGRYVDRFTLGPVSGAEGFDGTLTWSQDPSGQTRVDDSGDGREGAYNQAFVRSLSFLYLERRPGTVELGADRREGERTFAVLLLHPKRGRPLELWIDRATWRIDRLVEKTARETRTERFSDYRAVGELQVAHTRHVSNGEARYDQVIHLESYEVNPTLAAGLFDKPAGRTDDFAIAGGAGGKTRAILPFRLLNQHIYIPVRMNGGEPLQFLFDSGGMNMLTPTAAARLGLKGEGKIQGRGAGEKSEDVAITHVRETALGDVVLKDQTFYIFPLTGLDAAEGMRVDGIVGFEVLKRLVVKVDYEKRQLTFQRPEGFDEKGAGTLLPFTFDDQTPQVEGKIDGIPGRFTLDTGSRTSLTLHRPFAETHGLKEKYRPKVEAMTGWGVGGGVRTSVFRGQLFELGGVPVPAPLTEIAISEKGAFANRYVAGNVGGGVLRRFTVTFDYPRQRLFLRPNGDFNRADNFDRAGLWLNGEGGVFRVMDLVQGSPAAEAGLVVGDEITSIDGTKAADLLLSDVRQKLRDGAPGTEVRLAVRRGGAERTVVLTLRELI